MILAYAFLVGVAIFFIFYKTIYTHIGGQPWTDIMRKFFHDYPGIAMVLGFIIGVSVAPLWRWPYLIILGLGVLAGHVFWGVPFSGNTAAQRLVRLIKHLPGLRKN